MSPYFLLCGNTWSVKLRVKATTIPAYPFLALVLNQTESKKYLLRAAVMFKVIKGLSSWLSETLYINSFPAP